MSKGLKALKQYRNQQVGVNVYADELLDIVEKELKEHEQHEEILNDYGLTLANFREACLLLAMLKGEGRTIYNIDKQLKALEIIRNIGILRPYETCGGQCWLETMSDATKITKDNYDLLKEVLL